MIKKPAKQVTAHKARSYQQPNNLAIAPVEYGGLQAAYDHFNKELFSGTLPDVFITYQRNAHSAGYFSAERFYGRTGTFAKHELALNPDGFIGQSDKQICQTLVHEMVHVKQHVSGTPSARGYHNAEWAGMMKAIGLQRSSTGMVGGKETGQHMSDYEIPGGPFSTAFSQKRSVSEPAIGPPARSEGWCPQTARPSSPVRLAAKMLGANRIWISSAGLCSPADDGGLMELFPWEVATNSFATQTPVVPLCNIPAGQKT